MKRELTCIICPRGCPLTVTVQDGSATVQGNACPKGAVYGTDECLHPTRTLTSTVRVTNRTDTMVSVKTASPIPKEKLSDAMKRIRSLQIDAPVSLGTVVLEDLFGSPLITTCSIE